MYDARRIAWCEAALFDILPVRLAAVQCSRGDRHVAMVLEDATVRSHHVDIRQIDRCV